MPQNKQKTPLDRIVEASGIKYHMELIDYAKQRLEERKKKLEERNIEFLPKKQSEYFWAVYMFKRAIDSLREKPTCHFQSYYYLISNPNASGKESRQILTFQEYKKSKKNLDKKEKKGDVKIQRITICNTKKINHSAADSVEQIEIYADKSFHCPSRSLISYEDETNCYLKCNRPEISELMKKLGISDIEEFKENYFFRAEALAKTICENRNTLGILKDFYREGLERQTIESIINKAKEIIEKTKSQ